MRRWKTYHSVLTNDDAAAKVPTQAKDVADPKGMVSHELRELNRASLTGNAIIREFLSLAPELLKGVILVGIEVAGKTALAGHARRLHIARLAPPQLQVLLKPRDRRPQRRVVAAPEARPQLRLRWCVV